MSAQSEPATRKMFIAVVSDDGSEPRRRMVIHAATKGDAETIARRRGSADGLAKPLVESVT
jgi:hypothetical protein